MVFANLQEREKDAFFALLDEYFHSRPDILAALSGQGSPSSSNSGNKLSAINATTVGQRLFSAAPAMVAASKPRFGGGGGSSSFSGGGAGGSATTTTTTLSLSSSSQEQPQQVEESQPVAGRVAAAAAAFAQHRSVSSSSSPNLGSSTLGSRLGGMDTSSLKNVMAARAGQAGPPPSFNKMGAAAPPPPVARRQPEPEPEPEEQEETQGEWARALYDYESNEPGDLNIKENQHVLVTERSSDDWWTGELDGKSGLFPASYVELL